jgi:prepilin signal peptidase PulO-like enzyme (type II secretory pathway)
MIYTFAIFVFVFGIIIGSFLNVIILRYKTGRTVGGRSFCFSCGKTLHALELVPVLSFLFQKGRCKTCRTPLSWQYPIVELTTGLVFFIIYMKTISMFPFITILEMPFYFFVFSLLIIISVYDIRHKIVPDFVAFIFGLVSLLWLLATHDAVYFKSLEGALDLLAGLILFVPFYLLWFFSKGAWMGLGDGKLVIGIGLLLGLSRGVSAVIIGFWSAALVSLAILFLQKYVKWNLPFLKLKSEMPFAPFLVLGTLIAYYYAPDLLSLNVLLFG